MSICDPCKTAAGNTHHCDNVQTCPCQHRTTTKQEDGTLAPTSDRNALLMVEGEATIKLV